VLFVHYSPDSASKHRAPLSDVQHNVDQTIMRQPKLSYNQPALDFSENPLPPPPVSCAPVPTLGFGASSTVPDREKGQSRQTQQIPFDLMDSDLTFSAVPTKAAPVQEQPAVAEVYPGAEEREPGFAEGPDAENLEDYPQDPQGFLNGLVEGLTFVSKHLLAVLITASNSSIDLILFIHHVMLCASLQISRDLKTSQFAVGVRVSTFLGPHRLSQETQAIPEFTLFFDHAHLKLCA